MNKHLVLSIMGTVCLMASTAVLAQPAWSIVEDKSPTDNSPQVSAGLVVGEAALILRCREQKTEAAFSTKDTYLGDKPVARSRHGSPVLRTGRCAPSQGPTW